METKLVRREAPVPVDLLQSLRTLGISWQSSKKSSIFEVVLVSELNFEANQSSRIDGRTTRTASTEIQGRLVKV